MTDEERLLREWPNFFWEVETEQNTDAQALDSAQNSVNTTSVDSAAVSEGGESVSAGESAGISGDAGGAAAGNSASAGVGSSASAGVSAGAGVSASGGLGM